MRILYVDDEPSLLGLTKDFLEASGQAEVVTCGSAVEALDLLPSQNIKAIISDYQMPEMDGIEFLKVVRRRWPGMPFILFTGKGREEVAMEALHYGADSYIMKGGDAASQYKVLANEVSLAVARRDAEEAVHYNLSRFNLIMRNVSEIIFLVTEKGEISYASPSISSVLGYTRDEVEGQSIEILRDVFIENRADCTAMQGFQASLRQGGAMFRVRTKDGSDRTLYVTSAPISFDGQRLLVATAKDITHLKEVEDEMLMKERLFSAVLDRMSDAAGITDSATGRIIHINSKVTELLGWSYEEMIGKSTVELGVWSDEERSRALAPLMPGMASFTLEKEIQPKKGGMERFRVVVSRMAIEVPGRVGHFMLFTMQRTEGVDPKARGRAAAPSFSLVRSAD